LTNSCTKAYIAQKICFLGDFISMKKLSLLVLLASFAMASCNKAATDAAPAMELSVGTADHDMDAHIDHEDAPMLTDDATTDLADDQTVIVEDTQG
jgi:hypothetical protein